MSGFYDVYVLALKRTAEIATTFLDEFAPNREQAAEDYVTRDGRTLQTAADVIAHCEENSQESQNIYFRNCANDDPAHLMLFFTSDGGLILGLSVRGKEHAWFERLQTHTGSHVGYVSFEQPPPDSVELFRGIAAKSQ